MKKFFRRLGKTRFMAIALAILAAISYYFNGWLGVLAAIIGWCIGAFIYNWKEYKPRLINFLRHNTKLKVQAIIFIPIVAACIYCDGWRGLVAAIAGWCVGELICRRFLK